MYITISDAKQHLNIEADFHADDNYIIQLIKVAEDAIEKRIDRKLCSTLIDGFLPDSIRQAILLLVGNFYANREPVAFASATPIPYTFDFLADLNKHYQFV